MNQNDSNGYGGLGYLNEVQVDELEICKRDNCQKESRERGSKTIVL